MALEDLTGPNVFIDALEEANPFGGDEVREGADHTRGVKNVLKNQFPALDAAVTSTPAQLNGLLAYPVGAVFMTYDAANPATWFGGTWLQIAQGRMLMGEGSDGAGNTYAIGDTGGEATHVLTEAEMPAHTHTMENNVTAVNEGMAQSTGAAAWGRNAVTNSTGGGDAHENRPYYFTVAMWRRTA